MLSLAKIRCCLKDKEVSPTMYVWVVAPSAQHPLPLLANCAVFSSICQNFALRNFPSLALRASAPVASVLVSLAVSRYYYIISSANNCCTLEPCLSMEIQTVDLCLIYPAAHTNQLVGVLNSFLDYWYSFDGSLDLQKALFIMHHTF